VVKQAVVYIYMIKAIQNGYKKKKKKLGIVGHTCNPSYSGGRGRRIMNLRPV
jgi:hypothetical protein